MQLSKTLLCQIIEKTMVLIRKRYLTLTASTHITLMLGLCVLVQAPLAFAGHAQSYTVPPLAHAALENKSSAQAAAQGVTARVVVETSHRCGGPMVWQSGDAQPPVTCKVAKLVIKETTGSQPQSASFLLSPYGADAGMSYLQMGLYKLDATSPTPQVMVAAYTGGAHCCEVASLFGRMPDGTWHETSLGQNDGDGLPAVVDAAQNGAAQLQLLEQSFLYTFSSYAGSYAPLILYRYQAGALANVTRDAAYRPYLAARLKEAQQNWVKYGRSEPNGFLAYYVATKANMGQFAEGWRYMLAHKDNQPDTMFGISPCDLKPGNTRNCSKAEQKPLPFPKGLALFLAKNGYITAQQAQDVLSGHTQPAPPVALEGAGHYKPDFSCEPPPENNGVAQMLCQNSDAAKQELRFDQVYYALRYLVGQDGWKDLKQQVILDENAANQRCGLPIPGAVDQTVPDGAAACYSAEMGRLTEAYRARLQGAPAAEQEAARDIDQHIALQQKLIDLGYLPAGTVADGVYGEGTRAAITTWQRVAQRPEITGFLSQADAQTLIPTVSAAVTAPPAQLPGESATPAAQTPAPVPDNAVPPTQNTPRSIWSLWLVCMLSVVGLAVYVFPAVLAYVRNAPKKGLVVALNLLLGWTLIGWGAALVLALASVGKRQGE
ncbi:superinfection immunity protein [Acetobacter orientalis]|uniref:superinfection immunity protein n=1 Tax=Acetobacter orientalis TaxID=146474 RepID=UPI0039E93544